MNQTLVRRAGMALGLWRLWRYQWQSCESLPLTVAASEPARANAADTARWVGRIRIGDRAHHALFVPPGCYAAYRFVAPPHSRVVAWCGASSAGLPAANGIEFVATVHGEQASQDLTATWRLPAGSISGDRGWRKLVIELRNREVQHIELTLAIRMPSNGNAVGPSAYWGEPRLEWPRPREERRVALRAAARLVRRARLMSAARTLHGILSEGARNSRYQAWLRERSLSPAMTAEMRRQSGLFPYQPLVSVVTPVYNTDPRWLRACIESVRRQAYPNWELCLADDGSTRAETRAVLHEYEGDPRIKVTMLAANGGIAVATNEALKLAHGEFVAFLDHDDELTPDALFEMVAYLNQHQDTDLVYSDEDKLELDGTRSNVYFKPDWSPEHFLTNMYTCHLMVVRRSLVERIGGFRPGYEGAQDYDLVLRLMDHAARIHHVPKVLYQWRRIPESTAGHAGAKPWAHDAGKLALEDYVRRNRMNAEVLPGAISYVYRVRHRLDGEPLISIVLPALSGADGSRNDDWQACERTLAMLVERTAYRRLEVVLPIPRGRASSRALQLPPNLTVREVPIDGAAVSGRLRQQNLAAAHARGDHLLFLDWGLKPIDREWLTALLEFSQQAAIGAVGAKLHYPDGSLKHIGILLGVNGVAAPAIHRYPRSSLGYFGAAIAARNYSAVSGECLMTRRAVHDRVGGFDDEMGGFADIDYCLRVIDAGYRVVFTPYAALIQDKAAVAGREAGADDANRLRQRWNDRLMHDPYYNRNFSRNTPDYGLDLAANTQPLSAGDDGV